jgi:pimeloyl-ACP methyl ester carboxylesterase
MKFRNRNILQKVLISQTSIAISFTILSLAVVIANIDVLAEPYERSAELSNDINFSFARFEESEIHYASSGNPEKPGIIFIHGTPGGWQAFEEYLESEELQRDFFMIAVDRLGWGRSVLSPKLIDGDFDQQSLAILAVMGQHANKKWTILGHSLGASLAPKIAIKAPNRVDSLLLLAGSLKPKLGNPRWYNWAASTWAISSLIGDSMKHSNREIMGLRKQLKVMDAELKQTQLDADLLIIQGKKDKLVSPKNPAYAVDHWGASFRTIEVIELSDEGHFLPWRQAPLIVQSLYKLRANRSLQPE